MCLTKQNLPVRWTMSEMVLSLCEQWCPRWTGWTEINRHDSGCEPYPGRRVTGWSLSISYSSVSDMTASPINAGHLFDSPPEPLSSSPKIPPRWSTPSGSAAGTLYQPGWYWPSQVHGNPQVPWDRVRRVSSIMIEVNRSLYMDDGTGERSAMYGKCRASVGRIIGKIRKGWATQPIPQKRTRLTMSLAFPWTIQEKW